MLLWTPTHGRTSVGLLEITSRNDLFSSALWGIWKICWERWMIWKDKEKKREAGNFVQSVRLDNNDDDDFTREFFTPMLVGDLSLKTEWQQIFSSLQNSSQYYSRCHKYTSSPFSRLLMIVPSVLITITLTIILHSLFRS